MLSSKKMREMSSRKAFVKKADFFQLSAHHPNQSKPEPKKIN